MVLSSIVNIRFNSQRDGILLFGVKKGLALLRVSIPNGMEFYPRIVVEIYLMGVFQFPTGWNSTLTNLGGLLSAAFVSIPNGMEFYPVLTILSRQKERFQFPTGWNSTYARK